MKLMREVLLPSEQKRERKELGNVALAMVSGAGVLLFSAWWWTIFVASFN